MACLSEDRSTITLTGTAWSETIPATLLPRRIRFYRELCKLGGKNGADGPSAKFYRPTLAALEGVAREIDGINIKPVRTA